MINKSLISSNKFLDVLNKLQLQYPKSSPLHCNIFERTEADKFEFHKHRINYVLCIMYIMY